MKKLVTDSVFAIAVTSLLCAAPAQAYLDGATISLVMQAVAGAVASALLFGKLYLAKVKAFFGRRR